MVYECSAVRACKGAACDPVSNEPFPYTLASCTRLCPRKRIQETLPPKRGRTYRFRLERAGFLTCLLPDSPKGWTSFFLVQKVDTLIEVWFAKKNIFCQSATCFGTNQCCWDRDHRCQGTFMNAHHYGLLQLQFFTVSQTNICPCTLASCTWLCSADCIQETHRQKEGRTHNLLLDCTNIPHLLSTRSI